MMECKPVCSLCVSMWSRWALPSTEPGGAWPHVLERHCAESKRSARLQTLGSGQSCA